MNNLIGKTLGKYRLVGKLGSGGMAEVYKAYQPGLDRFVAIKVMHEHLGQDPEFVRRFQREASTAGRLAHPNVVQILDFDQVAGIYFMVMQFINGPSLKDEFKALRQQGQGFSLKAISRIFLALGSAIDYAHRHRMVHRDLKPGNIMINENGQVLLTDFGITRLLDGTRYTATGAMLGTPAYMSPEQSRGQGRWPQRYLHPRRYSLRAGYGQSPVRSAHAGGGADAARGPTAAAAPPDQCHPPAAGRRCHCQSPAKVPG